jgi:hypothetical protein
MGVPDDNDKIHWYLPLNKLRMPGNLPKLSLQIKFFGVPVTEYVAAANNVSRRAGF